MQIASNFVRVGEHALHLVQQCDESRIALLFTWDFVVIDFAHCSFSLIASVRIVATMAYAHAIFVAALPLGKITSSRFCSASRISWNRVD
jgi:cytochrome c oxidase assembly factor CtaG